MSDENKLVVASGKLMRANREEGVVVPFPSGNNYRVRPTTVVKLLKRGDLPNPLLAFLVDIFYNSANEQKVDAFMAAGQQKQNALDLLGSFKIICEEMFLQPRVVDEPQTDDEVRIEDIPATDQLFAFRVTFLGVDALRPFREEQATAVESVHGPENVPPPPQ